MAGIVSITVSIVYDNFHTQFIKPFFHLFLYLYFVSSSKKWNITVLLFLIAAMIGEFLTARNFVANYVYIVLLFATYFLIGLFLMKSAIKDSKFRIQLTDIYVGLIILIAFTYVVGSIFFITAEELGDFLFLLVATAAFSGFVGGCFYIAAYHSNPNKILFFVVGIGYMIVCVGTLVHELVMPSVFIQGFVNLVEVISQVAFIYALIKLPEMLRPKKWHI